VALSLRSASLFGGNYLVLNHKYKVLVKHIFIFLIVILSVSNSIAQNYYQPYQLPDSMPDAYLIDEDSLKEVMLNRIPEKYQNSIYAEAIDDYTGLQAEMVTGFLTSGNIYLDWPEIENYVNDIIKETLPADLIEKHHFRAYVTRDPSINAFVMNDGAIFVNIGLLAKIESEAALAFVIGHEVSHHLNHDVIDRFVKDHENRDKYETDKSLLGSIVGSVVAQNRTNSYSRGQESDADQLGLKLIKDTKYDLVKGVEVMKQFEELDKKYKLRRGGFFNGFLVGSTHPDSEDRYKSLKRRIRKQNGTSSFIVSEDKFHQIQQIALYESLESLLRVHQMYECFELSFKLWLTDQENSMYRYYLMESLRKMFYTNSYQMHQPIFQNEYRGRYRQKRKELDFEYQIRIAKQLKNIVSKALSIDKREVEAIEVPIWEEDTLGLITYNHLFNLVSKPDKLGDYPECYLTKGLKKYVEGSEYKEYLERYIEFPNAKYTQVANSILDSVAVSLPVKSIVMLTSYQDPEETDTLYKVYKNDIDSVFKTNFPNLIYKGIDDSDMFTFRQTVALSSLMEFMNSVGNSNSGAFNAWVYNPEYLDFYTELDIDKLHFLKVNVEDKEGERINHIVLKTIDLKPDKNQSTSVSKRKEKTSYVAIEAMLKESIELNTRYFE